MNFNNPPAYNLLDYHRRKYYQYLNEVARLEASAELQSRIVIDLTEDDDPPPIPTNIEIPVVNSPPPAPSTPPLILRDDLMDVQVITQEEFLNSIPGWRPRALNHPFHDFQ